MDRLELKLSEIVAKLRAGREPVMKVSELLKHAGQERRGRLVTERIRNVLGRYNLRTVPDFSEQLDIASSVRFELV